MVIEDRPVTVRRGRGRVNARYSPYPGPSPFPSQAGVGSESNPGSAIRPIAQPTGGPLTPIRLPVPADAFPHAFICTSEVHRIAVTAIQGCVGGSRAAHRTILSCHA